MTSPAWIQKRVDFVLSWSMSSVSTVKAPAAAAEVGAALPVVDEVTQLHCALRTYAVFPKVSILRICSSLKYLRACLCCYQLQFVQGMGAVLHE